MDGMSVFGRTLNVVDDGEDFLTSVRMPRPVNCAPSSPAPGLEIEIT
jgi:hypothetical protein